MRHISEGPSLVVYQHAEEAGFLAELRAQAVRAPHYDLDDLRTLDERLEAHLDGLRIAGRAGLDLLLRQLGAQASGEVFAATVLACESGDAAVLARIAEQLRAFPETGRGFAAALGWLDWTSVEPWVERLLAAPEPLFRRLGLEACGRHRIDPGPALPAGLAHAEPGVVARAARSAGELRRRDLMAEIRAHRRHADEAVRFWANWATAQMGDEEALEPLRRFAGQAGEFQWRALSVLVGWQDHAFSVAWLRALAHNPAQRRPVILGAGLLGDPLAVPWLIRQMHELPLARIAGEAFSLIAGADLALLDLERSEIPDFDAGPTDDPRDPRVAMDPDEDLPWPDPARIAAWWQANGASLETGRRHLLGRPLDEAQCRQVLCRGRQRQRNAAAVALARLRPGEPLFPTDAPTKRQQVLLDAHG
ncbi:TIGR02270 family protein [Azotobacter beijerinckii]|nr:TIGR02270 family protein [Azotobacter beijerinckii]